MLPFIYEIVTLKRNLFKQSINEARINYNSRKFFLDFLWTLGWGMGVLRV